MLISNLSFNTDNYKTHTHTHTSTNNKNANLLQRGKALIKTWNKEVCFLQVVVFTPAIFCSRLLCNKCCSNVALGGKDNSQ